IASKVGMKEIPFSGSNLQAMATATLEAFNSRNISLFLNDELIGDLKRLRVEERSYGFRLVSPRTGAGHGDLATAFQLAVLGTKTIQAQPVYGSKPQGARGGLYIDLGRSYQSCTGKRIF
ncbi:MAG TPA: hypothetical protein VNQ76_20855, partial [Planctomicrobium sp.]|nr:hypothetical protein [Planctomicrobium sp.]